MTREEMMTNLQEHQYNGDGSVGLSAMYFAFGNPITDSMVVNAYAKTNKAAFQMALDTGIYRNHTVMGGNFLYNTLNNNRFTGKLFKGLESGSVKPFAKIKGLNKIEALKNFSLNFISSSDIDKNVNRGVTNIAEKTGLNKTSEIVRTGWGFGKDYSGFFKTLKGIGYTAENFDNRIYKREIISRNYQGTVNKRNHAVKKNAKKNQRKIKFVEKADDVVENVGLNVKKTTSVKSTAVNGIEWSAQNLSDDILKIVKNGTDDNVLKLADEFVKIGGKLSNYSTGMKVATKELREELVGGIGKIFATRTTFEKIISNPLVRIATGAAISLPASISMPLMVATTGVGMAASIGQENAINNFINSHLYNTNQYDQYSSSEATSSIYSAANIRNVNLQALANSYQNINVANRYLNDIDPISSDYSYKLDDTETM